MIAEASEFNTKDILRFYSHVDKSGNCWIWHGTKVKGYGCFWLNGKMLRAHRFAYQLANGSIPAGMCVCHHCDNPSCVRPDHLFAATHQENRLDAKSKGRLPTGERHGWYTHPEKRPRGENHGSAKLTTGQVLAIRQAFATGQSQTHIANRFGIGQTTVFHIIRRETWTHI